MPSLDVDRQWVDRDYYGRSISWSVRGFKGLHLRQSSSSWQFDLIVSSFDLIDHGWDEHTRITHLVEEERQNPGSTDLGLYPESYFKTVRIFRVMTGQNFPTRKKALDHLEAALFCGLDSK